MIRHTIWVIFWRFFLDHNLVGEWDNSGSGGLHFLVAWCLSNLVFVRICDFGFFFLGRNESWPAWMFNKSRHFKLNNEKTSAVWVEGISHDPGTFSRI